VEEQQNLIKQIFQSFKSPKKWKSFVNSTFNSGKKEFIEELLQEEASPGLNSPKDPLEIGHNISSILSASKTEPNLNKNKHTIEDYARERRAVLRKMVKKMNWPINGFEGIGKKNKKKRRKTKSKPKTQFQFEAPNSNKKLEIPDSKMPEYEAIKQSNRNLIKKVQTYMNKEHFDLKYQGKTDAHTNIK